jgi:glycosyltransferase involved in cell wall biosynthesis
LTASFAAWQIPAVPKVHWVYSSGPQVRTPFAIGRNVAAALRRRGHEVVQWDWEDDRVIEPGPGDVLLGHSHPVGRTVFRRSARRPGWRRVLAMQPYAHGRIEYVAFLDQVLPHCDQFLAITGSHWFSRIGESAVAHWRPKMVHLDLAVDRGDFPRSKGAFNPPGKRRFLYVGTGVPFKNLPYLSAIARRCAPTEFAWIGSDAPLAGVRLLGWADFATAAGRALAAEHDFMITVGDSDANPTTLLEAASWGLIPVCTPQSGYDAAREPGFVNVPLGDVEGAARVVEELQACPSGRLERLRAENERRLDTHYTWERFCREVAEAVEGELSPPLDPEPAARRLGLRWSALTGDLSPLRRRHRSRVRRYNRARRRAARQARVPG